MENLKDDKPPPYESLNTPLVNPHNGYPIQAVPPQASPLSGYGTMDSNYQQAQHYPNQAGNQYTSYNNQYQPLVNHFEQPTVVSHIQHPQTIVVVGGCPACRVGVLEDDYTCFGVFCAVFFFPLGLLFCLALKQRHCPNCGAVFS